MTERRILALLALLIGLVGGLLILSNAINGLRGGVNLNNFLDLLVFLVLGLAVLLGSVLIYRGNYGAGGLVDILLGVVALILNANTTGSILAIVAGVIGLVAAPTRGTA